MNRLELYLAHKEKVNYPEDIYALKEHIKGLREVPDVVVQRLYSQWSEDNYCAGWLIIDQDGIQSFRSWLLEDVNV